GSSRRRRGEESLRPRLPQREIKSGVAFEQAPPALVPELFQRGDVARDDRVRVGEGLDRARNAVLAQQVQRRPRGAVGEVGDVVRAAAGKPVLGMETGNLQFALEPE